MMPTWKLRPLFAAVAWAMWFALPLSQTRAGTITLTLDSAESITAATAVLQQETSIGVQPRPFPGRFAGDALTFADLPPGRYDLRFETPSGRIWGWDASVPPSDYEEEQPLSDAGRRTVFQKLSRDNVSGFDDYVAVLDLQGNIHNAAVLSVHLRTRPFVEGDGVKRDTWIWRLNRTQWHDPDEINWQPFRRKPYYALVRERINQQAEWQTKRYLLARHLGGLEVADADSRIDLGIVKLPKVEAGLYAIDPEGRIIPPVVLKGVGAIDLGRVHSFSVPAEVEGNDE